jgi:hypothetical protein
MRMRETESSSPSKKPVAILELCAVVAGSALAVVILHFALRGGETKFEDLALGKATTSVYASVDGHKIHCNGVDGSEACIDGIRKRGATQVALWLGNSQIHAINQWKPDQETATAILHRRFQPRGIDVVAFSLPNARLEEYYLLFTYLSSRIPIRYLILSVVFDDLRGTQLRPLMMGALKDPATLAALERSEVGRQIAKRYGDEPSGDFAALEETVQEHSEAALNGWLERHWKLWALRPEARGRFFLSLYDIRNTVLGITAQSKRKMIAGPYRNNMAALESLLDASTRAGVGVVLYIVPIRDDVEIPYDAREYQRFKRELEEIAARHGVSCSNLEGIVPGPLWGLKAPTNIGGRLEIDFMHFQAQGHVLLANAVGELLEAQLNGDPR